MGNESALGGRTGTTVLSSPGQRSHLIAPPQDVSVPNMEHTQHDLAQEKTMILAHVLKTRLCGLIRESVYDA
jgi:hypothetical protein